ncbi:MAG: TrkA family potassium uptake protein [Oscillospiraceae bacterium]|nr:TrkA family potassium uptake protein [Oscillospiraceae bacterium]
MKSYIVAGLGRFGSEVARQLCAHGCEVLAIDTDSDLVQQIADHVTHAVTVDVTDKAAMKALDAASFDCAVVAIGDDLAVSVLATMTLQELGVGRIICKAYDETHRKVLLKLGAHQVVIPEKEHAARLAKSLSSTNVLDYIELSAECGIIETPVPRSWVGKTLKELNVRAQLGVNIIAVHRNEKINVSPAADFRVAPGDIMVILGDNEALDRVQKL